MNQQEQDQKIKDFLDQIPAEYTFNADEITYLKQYSGCEIPIPDAVILKLREMIKKRMPSIFDETQVNFPSMTPKHILTIGLGAEKVVEGNYCTVTSFLNDYYCYMASKGMYQEKIRDGSYRIKFRNLADYFTNYQGNNIKYSAVVVIPEKTGYHRMDIDHNFALIDPYIYYVLRGYFFTRPGGAVFAAIPKMCREIMEKKKELLGENAKMEILALGDYCLVQIDKPAE